MLTSRRSFLGRATATGFGSLFGTQICRALANPARPTNLGTFKRCVVLWMEGGPSQQDTFDPKPSSPRKSVATKVDGVRFAETLPGLARRADQLCMVRSVGSREGEHARATELMHTGFSPLPSFPRPALGSMISHGSRDHDLGFPRYVTLGGNGFGPAFLGTEHGPFVIEEIDAARRQLNQVKQKRNAIELLTTFNARYSEQTYASASAERTSQVDSVRRLLSTGFTDALDLNSASPSERQKYGDQPFAQRVLAARRLLELGVPFVEAQLGGWDTHVDNQRQTDRLCRQLEQPWLALMDDLQRSGMWDDTLIAWMGEFGRTPRLNGRAGRDHFPEINPIVLAGGNLGGQVIGQTSDDGSARVGEKHAVADLFATLLTLMGLDAGAQYTTNFGSPTTPTDDGKPIAELVAG